MRLETVGNLKICSSQYIFQEFAGGELNSTMFILVFFLTESAHTYKADTRE